MRRISILLLSFSLGACGDEGTPAPAPTSNAPLEVAAPKLGVVLSVPAEVEEGQEFGASATVSGNSEPNVRYEWSQASAGPRVIIPRNYSSEVTMRAPEALADYDLTLALRVACGSESSVEQAVVRVRADDDLPQVEIVAPERVECGEQVSLSGQVYNEFFQGVALEWVQTDAGPRIELEGRDRLHTSFVAPEHEGPYEIELELRANDGVHPTATASRRITVDCDPGAAPLPAGSTLTLSGEPGFSNPLPRGAWELEGSLEFTPAAGEAGTVRLLLEAETLAGALVLAGYADERALSTLALERAPDGVWREPQWGGGMPLGEWPANVPLGFLFQFDGSEIAVRFGPAGERANWSELPFELQLPLTKRPQAFRVEVLGGDARCSAVELRAK